MLTRKRKILAKLETTYGTDAVPTAAADGVLLRSLDVTPLSLTYDERTLIRDYLGGFEQAIAQKMVKITAELEIAGFGSAGPAAPTAGYDALLRACARSRTVTAGTKVDYAPVSSGFDSITCYYEKDGVLQKATGCRGALTFDMSNGKIPSYKMALIGIYAGPADASVGTPVVSAYQTPRAVNSANTTGIIIAGYNSAIIKSFSYDDGLKVDLTNYPGGTELVQVTDRAATGKVSVQATTVAAQDWLSAVADGTLASFQIVHGPATNQLKFSAPKGQLTNPAESDDNGIAFFDFDVNFLPTSGNDEDLISIL